MNQLILIEWVQLQGGLNEAALLLGIEPRRLRSWTDNTRSPPNLSAMNIVIKTEGKVSYNDLFISKAKQLFNTNSKEYRILNKIGA